LHPPNFKDEDGEFFNDEMGSITEDSKSLLNRIEDGHEGMKPEDAAANSSGSFKYLVCTKSLYIVRYHQKLPCMYQNNLEVSLSS